MTGFSRTYRFGSCKKCEAKGIQCERDYETLKQNFWWSWDYNRKCLVKYLAFVDNLETRDIRNLSNLARESNTFRCVIPKAHRCPVKGICLGGILAKCQKGYTGPLCVLSKKGYYKHFRSCAKCPRFWIVCLQLLAYLIVFIFVCTLVNWAGKLIVKLTHGEQRSLADIILSMLKILLGFY